MYEMAKLEEHPKLQELYEQLQFTERKVENKVKKLQEETNKDFKAIWDDVESYVMKNKLYRGDYNKETSQISFNDKYKTLVYRGEVTDSPFNFIIDGMKK